MARRTPPMTDRQVISEFVAYLAANGRPGLSVDRWPEDEKDGEIDAVAGDLAIEHTSIDTLPDQRRDSAWFARVVARLEEVTTSKNLYVVLENDAVRKGQEWDAISEALRRWLQNEGQHLAAGRHQVRIPGVPFPVHVYQWDAPPSFTPRLLFGRYVPNDATLPQRLKELCDRKIRKLARHKAEGRTTILLLENDDIANMNHVILSEAVRAAYPDGLPSGVDQVWYASTAFQPELHILDLSKLWHSHVGTPIIWPPESRSAS